MCAIVRVIVCLLTTRGVWGRGGGAWAYICILQSYSAYLKLYDTFIYNIPLHVYFQEYPDGGLTDVQPFCYW